MKIQLSDHFSYGRLLKFVMPSVFMMMFTSVYGVVDGFFVSNFVGKTEFTALNFIMPFLNILATFGFMLGTGGSALVSKTLGEGNNEKANELFSLFVYITLGVGVIFAVVGYIALPYVAKIMGAEGDLLYFSVKYGRVIALGTPAFMLQLEMHGFCVTAEKQNLPFIISTVAGIANMVLDALFIALFKWGLEGAAAATVVGQCIGGFAPLIYFARKNDSLLRLTKAPFDGKSLLKACTNGSSELMSQISMSLVGALYNIQLLKYAGENGVAAYGVLMYVNFVFISAFIGYTIGTAPLIGFNYGAQNKEELKNIKKKSLIVIGIAASCMFILAETLAKPLAYIFTNYDEELLAMTLNAFKIFSFSFLFSGFAIFFSSFFTALNDGLTSAIISFMRTLVFQIAAVLLLPLVLGVNGIWLSVVVAEIMAVTVSLICLFANRKKYGY